MTTSITTSSVFHQPTSQLLQTTAVIPTMTTILLATAMQYYTYYTVALLLLPPTTLPTAWAAKAPFTYSSIAERRMLMQDRAILHVNLMNTIGLCRRPRPQIFYPPATPQKIFYPRGTLLHRCADITGCCPNPGEACRPETIETVERVFFVNHFAFGQKFASGQRTRLKAPTRNFTTTTEVLTFTNHTSCKCIKLAADAIEHDELQSVVSRPLVKLSSTESIIASTGWFYHLIGGLAALTLLLVILILWKWLYVHRWPIVMRRRNDADLQ